MKSKYLLIIILLFFFQPILFSQTKEGISRSVSMSTEKIKIDYSLGSFSEVKSLFSNFNLFFHQCGMPSVPILTDFVVLPKGSFSNFKISTALQKKTIPLAIPQSTPKTIDSDQFVDSICSTEYHQIDTYLPSQKGEISSLLEFEGFDVLYFYVYPFQYNPLRKKLDIYTNLSVEISVNHAFDVIPQSVNSVDYSILSKAANFNKISQFFVSANDSFSNYVIVTHPTFSQAADSFALWKSQQGYVVSKYQHVQWTADSIRSLMLQLYSSSSLKPSYLLLFGDTNTVPSFEKIAPPPIPEAFSTDLYFTTMDSDSDLVSNFSVGRISVSNPMEAFNVVNKLIQFQKYPPTQSSYYSTMVNCSYFQDDDLNGYDDRRFVQTSEEVRSYLQTYYGKNVERIYEASSSSNPLFWNNDTYSNGESIPIDIQKPLFAWNGIGADIINKMNAGTFLLLHRDHGYSNASGWAHPHLATSQLTGLTNDTLLPLVFSINCYSGNFRVGESFAERLIRQNTGACGVFAPSYYSYSGNNDAYTLGLYDALFPNPGLFPPFTGTGGNHTPETSSHFQFNRPGDMLRYAIWYMNNFWGFDTYSTQIAHFFGDPAMYVYTEPPLQAAFTHLDTIDCIDSCFKINGTNTDGFLATLTVDNQVISRSYFQNDTVVLYFLPQYASRAVLTITKDGYSPYISSIYWHCSQPIYKPVAGFSFSDSMTCNLPIQFTDSSLYFPTSWFWDFGDGTYSTLQSPLHHYSQSGIYSIKLTVSNPHGVDSVILNNAIHFYAPQSLDPIDSIVCIMQNYTLSFHTDDSIAWYETILSTAPVWNNSIVLTPDTTVFASTYQDMSTVAIGKLDTIGGGGFIYQNREHYLHFNLHADVLLKSVDIYSMSPGQKTIKVLNNNNQVVTTKSVTFTEGKNTIFLDFYIPMGDNYKLVAPAYVSWYANISFSNFPYSIQNIIDIDSSSQGNNYYYFYNWNIQKRCFSPKSQISISLVDIDTLLSMSGSWMLCDNLPIQITSDSTATVVWNNGSTEPTLNTNLSGVYYAQLEKNNCLFTTDSIYLIDETPILVDFVALSPFSPCCFQNNSQNATHFTWDFGDGSFSNEISPCHDFPIAGEYLVKLTAMNNCDTLFVSKYIGITHIEESEKNEFEIVITPNPTISTSEIEFRGDQLPFQINVFNIFGELVSSQSIDQSNINVDFQNLSAGIYYLKIDFSHYSQYFKVLKINP